MIVSPTVVLSPTRVGEGLGCLRKHALNDILGQVSNEASNVYLEFGTRMHSAVAAYWTICEYKAGQPVAVAEATALLRSFEWPLNDKHTLQLALNMFQAYTAQALLMPFGSDEEWVIETLETRLSLPVEFGTLSFQIDRLLRNLNTGQRALVDLKTASRCDARWTAQWSRDLQMMLYAECCAQHYGEPLSWQIIEGLAKDKPAVHYVTIPEITEERRTEARASVEWIARHDSQLLDSARLPDGSIDVTRLTEFVLTRTPANHKNCWSYNSACTFLPLCDAEPGERSALLAADYHYEQPKHLV